MAAKEGAKIAVEEGAKAAGKAAGSEILKRIGGAAGMGAAIDGAFATAEAIYGYGTHTMTGPEAVKHVAVEAGTGALATAAGVGVAAATVILTGGLAAPAMFVLGAGTTIIAKLGFKKLLGN